MMEDPPLLPAEDVPQHVGGHHHHQQHDSEMPPPPFYPNQQQDHQQQQQLPPPHIMGPPPQVRLRIGPHVAFRTAQQRRRQQQYNAAIMAELNNNNDCGGDANEQGEDGQDDDENKKQQQQEKYTSFPFSTICDLGAGNSPTKAAPHKQYPARVPFPHEAIPAPVQTFSGRGLGQFAANNNSGAGAATGGGVAPKLKSRCPTQSAAQLLEIARRSATINSPYNFHRFGYEYSAAAAASAANQLKQNHQTLTGTTTAASRQQATAGAGAAGAGGKATATTLSVAAVPFKPADNLSPLIKEPPTAAAQGFDKAATEQEKQQQQQRSSESPTPNKNDGSDDKKFPPRLQSTLSLATTTATVTPSDSPAPSPQKNQQQQLAATTTQAAAAVAEDKDEKLCLSSFDALFLKLAPAPRCFSSSSLPSASSSTVPPPPPTAAAESTTDFPVYSEAEFLAIGLGWAQRSCSEHKKHFPSVTKQQKKKKKNNNNNGDKEDVNDDNDAAEEQEENTCCTYVDRMSNLLSVIYPQWEDHLRVAMAACTTNPGSSLMVSERLLPPLYMARPELHDLVVEKMTTALMNKHTNNNNDMGGDAADDNAKNATHDKKYAAAVSDVTSSVSSPLSSSTPAASSPAAAAAAAASPAVAASPLTSSSGIASPSSEEGAAAGSSNRGSLFALPTRGRPQRLKAELHNKVMSVLSRVTPVKYNELRTELLDLPIRQASEEQLDKVVDVFFMKAVQEPAFSNLYADLVMSVFDVANAEKEALKQRVVASAAAGAASSSSMLSPPDSLAGQHAQFPDPAGGGGGDSACNSRANSALSSFEERTAQRTEQLAHRLRTSLLHKCHKEFSRPPVLDTQRDLTDRETGELLSLAEQQDRWSTFRKRLKANVRFVGELYNRGAVTDCVVNAALSVLLIQVGALASARIPPYARGGGCKNMNDHVVELFVTMLEVVGPRFRAMMPQRCERMLETARHLAKTHPTPRTRFLLLNLLDAADGKGDKRWSARSMTAATATNTPASAMSSPAGGAPHLNSGFSSPATPYHQHQHPLPHQQHHHHHHHAHGHGGHFPHHGSNLSLPSRMSSMSRMGSAQDLSGSGMMAPASGSGSGGSGNRPPPPSYEHAVASTSNPSSPVASLPGSAASGGVGGGLPPPLHNSSSNSSGFPSQGNSCKASSDDLSSKATIDSNKQQDLVREYNTQQSIATATRHVPSSQRLHLLCNLPSSAECALSSDESVSLGEGFLQLAKHEEEIFAEYKKQHQQQRQQHQNAEATDKTEAQGGAEDEEEEEEEDDAFGQLDDLPPKLLDFKFHHLLAFVVPGSRGPVRRQQQLKNAVFVSTVHKCLWEPADKMWNIVCPSATATATEAAVVDALPSPAAVESQLITLFSEMLAAAQNNSSIGGGAAATALFRSGLACLIALGVSTPRADGTGLRALSPAVAKKALVQALTGTGVVADSSDIAQVCCGGMPVAQQQSTTSRFFEALGGGGEGSEGYDAVQRLCRGWTAFCSEL